MDDLYFEHSGTPHEGMTPHSGRYPYGSGENPNQRPKDLIANIDKLRSEDVDDLTIAKGLGYSSAKDMEKAYRFAKKQTMSSADFVSKMEECKSKGMSSSEIASEFGVDSIKELNAEYDRIIDIRNTIPEGMELNGDFKKAVQNLEEKGYTYSQMATALDIESANRLRAKYSIATNYEKRQKIASNQALIDQGITNRSERARMLGEKESTLRNWENGNVYDRSSIDINTANTLKNYLNDYKYLDVGYGTAQRMGVPENRLKVALEILKEDGYDVMNIPEKQMFGSNGNITTMKTLVPPGTDFKDVINNRNDIKRPEIYSEDGGATFDERKIKPPISIDSDRIYIRYAEDGGELKDGVMELRRGVPDISLGKTTDYAQVRIAVDDKMYLKGMALYGSDKNFPKGYDIIFNTNKAKGTPIEDVLKPLKKDKDNPFGAEIQKQPDDYIDISTGQKKQSAINIVNEEGKWNDWSRTIASQMLSKQRPEVIKQQLDLTYAEKKERLDTISQLTNPTVKKKMLDDLAESLDSSAVMLKATHFPGQTTRVLLPFNDIDDNSIYCPGLENGTTVALVRFPHGGIFEIPELKVNNKIKSAKEAIGDAPDAVGINHRVASTLSGADFDGDTALVIPTRTPNGDVITNLKTRKSIDTKPYDELIDFNPKQYKFPPEIKEDNRLWMKKKQRGIEMGKATNLIADMTLAGAEPKEIVQAVKYSMVVIDAHKHGLDWQQAREDYKISQLNERYRGRGDAGASSLITRAKSEEHVPYRREKKVSQMTQDELERYYNGEKIWEYTGKTKWVKTNKKDENGKDIWVKELKTVKSTKMAEHDPYELISESHPTIVENYYARYASKIKALANEARKQSRAIDNYKVDPEAKKKYKAEVKSLRDKLTVAIKNKPLEREAQRVANALFRMKKEGNPDMDKDDIKKLKSICLKTARERVGAKRQPVEITPREWEAIQNRALSADTLNLIFMNTDMDVVKEYAMPHTSKGLTQAQINIAKAKIKRGYSVSDVANSLGVSTSVIYDNVNVKEIQHSATLPPEYNPMRYHV